VNFQAQNALLKILEEPPEHVRIALIVPTRDTLIPTVLSRLYVVTPTRSEPTNEVFETFRTQSCAARLEEISERTKQKDVSWIDAVFRGAALYAHQNVVKQPHIARTVANAVALYAEGTTATKMLLEDIALSLP
jgi:DNA polymerase III delta prime subunit